jgi:Ligand-gated ion channel
MRLPQWTRQSIYPMMLLLILIMMVLPSPSMGGQLATFKERHMTNNTNHRQNVCDRHAAYQNGSVPLKDALKGLKLNALIMSGEFFFYDEETGIDETKTGILELLLDELADRAGFTWRDSFGVQYGPEDGSWLELLLWGTESYDISCDWWAESLERLRLGVQFLTPWYDSSLVLLTKRVDEVISDEIVLSNWLLPYETSVWLLTILTVILSGLVHQWLEWLQDERDDRSLWEWWLENWYLSALNFTQTYEFQPKTLASRLFGVSMAIWALVMTATYTANLASLLVARKPASVVIENVEQAAVYGLPICLMAGTYADTIIKNDYQSALRILKYSEDSLYQGLHNGECAFIATSLRSYEKYKKIKRFNPTCDLVRVGEPTYTITDGSAGFAMRGDAGELCSSLISQVINYHMKSIIEEGVLADLWDRENKRTQTFDCDLVDPSSFLSVTDEPTEIPTKAPGEPIVIIPLDAPGTRARSRQRYLLEAEQHLGPGRKNRILKAGGGAVGGAVAVKEDSELEGQQLTLEQMIGIFVYHWTIMAISILIAYWNITYNRHFKRPVGKDVNEVGQVMGIKLFDKLTGRSTNEEHHDRKDDAADVERERTIHNSNITQPLSASVRQSFLTNETSNCDDEAKECSDESVPDKTNNCQELTELRTFHLKILEEQRAMQQQMREEHLAMQQQMREEHRAMQQHMRDLRAAIAAPPSVSNAH